MSWLLALHSSSETLGVGVRCLAGVGGGGQRIAAFPLGRALANELLTCVEQLLPAEQWPQLTRLAVATGPGGFTGTRLTVVLARTLAQQLQLPLDGVSSFLLAARRQRLAQPTWLTQELPRRGVVAGLYGPDPAVPGGMAELEQPQLFASIADIPASPAAGVLPQVPAAVELPADVEQLLEVSAACRQGGLPAPWQAVLPLYPTAPVAGA